MGTALVTEGNGCYFVWCWAKWRCSGEREPYITRKATGKVLGEFKHLLHLLGGHSIQQQKKKPKILMNNVVILLVLGPSCRMNLKQN